MNQFKPLEFNTKFKPGRINLRNAHTKKTIIYVVFGVLINGVDWTMILESMFIGSLFGLFMTNSPCARGKC